LTSQKSVYLYPSLLYDYIEHRKIKKIKPPVYAGWHDTFLVLHADKMLALCQKLYYIYDKRSPMSVLATSILQAASNLPEGGLVSPKEFLHLGGREAVDQTFTRLVRQGKLFRVCRGLYVLPAESRFGKRTPEAEKILESLSQKSGEIIVPHGAAMANRLGLSTQVPIKEIFLTSGHSRALTLGQRTITLKHAPSWLLLLGYRPGGAVIRALAWLGKKQAEHFMPQLRDKITKAEWQAVAEVRFKLPDWLAKTVSRAAFHA
jgi:hypothetical protein